MARHSFIRMSKLPNVKGRIDYISSPDRQENLYATYQTADTEFWKNLAFESQQEFRRFGTEGKCIEARELIIALPEVPHRSSQTTANFWRPTPMLGRNGNIDHPFSRLPMRDRFLLRYIQHNGIQLRHDSAKR